jgi:hypothetical protein
MPEHMTRFALYISSDVPQQELWDLNDQINQIEGVKADLREERNVVADTIMMVVTIVGPILTLAEGAKSVYELAKILYELAHKKEEGHHVTINKNGAKIEIKNMSLEDIEKILRNM